jgi:hypothetical protein
LFAFREQRPEDARAFLRFRRRLQQKPAARRRDGPAQDTRALQADKAPRFLPSSFLHGGFQARYRTSPIHDQDRLPVTHAIQQRAQLIFRLSNGGLFYKAIIAIS